MSSRQRLAVYTAFCLFAGSTAISPPRAYSDGIKDVNDALKNEQKTMAETLHASYAQINTLSCLVRKTTEIEGRRLSMLSRVYYQRPDRLHVENILPVKRRILSDGARFYFSIEDSEICYSVPLEELTGEWKITQKSVPGTPMEHLMRLQNVKEIILDAGHDFPIRRGYQAEHVFVVLSCDEQGRPAQIELFEKDDMINRIAVYKYDNFVRVSDDCWVATRHRAEITINGETLRETRRFDNLQINEPIAAGMFDAGAFFEGKTFVSDFSEME